VTTQTLTLIDDGAPREIAATLTESAARVAAGELERALGWQLKPEGLCRDAICIPVRDRAGLENHEGVDLSRFAEAVGRPLALDLEERAAALGASREERAGLLEDLVAPDFRLPDLQGRRHSLSAHRGKKVLLVAYASW